MTMVKPVVLFVLTQREPLSRLPAGLAESQQGWQSIRVADAGTALDVISQRSVSVVVACFGSDLTGCDLFFNQLQEQSPAIIRLLLLSEIDIGTALGCAHQSIAAQSGFGVIERAITKGLSLWQRTQGNGDLTALLSHVDKLPTPPALYFNIRDEIESPTCGPESIARIIAHDQALSASILKVANSGFYGPSRSVADLQQAISLVGMDVVSGLLLSVHLYDRLPLPGFNLDALWMHGAVVSKLAQYIAREEGGDAEAINASGMAGLLHDIGTFFMVSKFPDQYQSIMHQADGDELRAIELEKNCFGVSHAELGGLVLDLWCMPADVVEAVIHHHCAAQVTSLPAKAVFLAEWMVNEYLHCGGDTPGAGGLTCPLNSGSSQLENRWEVCKRLLENVGD